MNMRDVEAEEEACKVQFLLELSLVDVGQHLLEPARSTRIFVIELNDTSHSRCLIKLEQTSLFFHFIPSHRSLAGLSQVDNNFIHAKYLF